MNIQGLPQVEIYSLHLIVLMLLCLDYNVILRVPYLSNGYKIYSCYDLFSSLRCSWRYMKASGRNSEEETKTGHFIELHVCRAFILTLAFLSLIMMLLVAFLQLYFI